MEDLKAHFKEINNTLVLSKVHLQALQKRVIQQTDVDTELESEMDDKHLLKTHEGISLLELKIHTLVQYIKYLTLFMMFKADGRSVEGHPIIARLVELRLCLEKIKPIETKLKYQIEKLTKLAKSHETAENSVIAVEPSAEALSFKPNLEDLLSDEAELQEEKPVQTPQIPEKYRAPRLAPVYFDDDAPRTKAQKQLKDEQRQLERAKQRASSSRLMRDLMTQYDERPEELSTTGLQVDYQRLADADKNIARYQQKLKYDEENFTRMPTTRQDKRAIRDMQKESYRAADELRQLDRDFADVMHLDRLAKDSDRRQDIANRGAVQRKNKRMKQAHEEGSNALQEKVAQMQSESAERAGAGFKKKTNLTERRIRSRKKKNL